MSDDEILNRKQTLLIYPQGAGGHLIQRLLHRIRDNKLHDDIVVSESGDCHYQEPQGNYDTLELHHYSHLSVLDDFDYKGAVLSHYRQHVKTDNIVKMHPGDSPYLVDKLAKFLPNTEFAIIHTTSYLEELACSLMQIKKWDLSPNQWNVTKIELLNFFPDDNILKNAAQFSALNDISFEFDCYLTWLVFLRSGYPTLKFDDVFSTPSDKVNYLQFSDIFSNKKQSLIDFCSAVLHREITGTEKQFISDQLSSYLQKQNRLLLDDPVGYLRVISKVAAEFSTNNNRRYRSFRPSVSGISNLLPTTIVVYRAGCAGQFITGIINTVESDDLTIDIAVTDEGEYKRGQLRARSMMDMHRDFSLQNVMKELYYNQASKAVFSTLVTDIGTIRKFLPNSKLVVITANSYSDKLAAWFNAMYKHSLGVERWEGISDPHDKPTDREEAISLLSAKVSDVHGMISALNSLPLLEQKDILLSELIDNDEMKMSLSIEDPIMQSDMYSIPYSYIRFGDVDRFISAIDNIIPLNEKSEEFVRRNFNNYYSKQNHLMMHDPENYMQQIEEKARSFLTQFK